MHTRSGKCGVKLASVLVVIGGITVLFILAPLAIQSSREATRRSQCSDNLRQIATTLASYHDVHKMFPMGATHSGPDPGGEERLVSVAEGQVGDLQRGCDAVHRVLLEDWVKDSTRVSISGFCDFAIFRSPDFLPSQGREIETSQNRSIGKSRNREIGQSGNRPLAKSENRQVSPPPTTACGRPLPCPRAGTCARRSSPAAPA